MTEIEAAQAQLLEVVRDVEALRYRLVGIQATLPVAVHVGDSLGEEEPETASGTIHAAIGCVLVDQIEPALRDLLTVATHPKERGEEP